MVRPYKRKTFKPQRKVTTASKALSLATKLKTQMKTVGEQVRGTVKTSTDPFNSTPVVDLIEATGDGLRTRITSVQVQGTIKSNLTSALSDDYRIDLVLDRQPKGVKVTPLEVYGNATPAIGALKNLTYKERFKILKSKTGVFNKACMTVGIPLNWYVKTNLISESATANSFTQANVQTNAIYLIYWTTAAANQPIPNLTSVLNCYDSNA